MIEQAETIRERVLEVFESEAKALGQIDYRELLEELICGFEGRLACIKEEMAAAEDDE